MNIKLNLTIPFRNSSETLECSFDTLLKPFYVSEREILNIFFDEYNHKYFKMIREFIFLNSLKADEILGKDLSGVSEKDLLLLKKKLTTCLTIRMFGNKFNKDYIGSLTRSKSFAEFSVSTTKRNDPRFVLSIIQEAEECVKHLESLINIDDVLRPPTGSTFVKGGSNLSNSQVASRLWHHGNLRILSEEIVAVDKKWFDGKLYKNGRKD